MTGRKLRSQITFAFFGSTNVVQEQSQHVAVDLAAANNPDRRNAKAFLIDLAARPHRSGIGPSDVGVMRPSGNIKGRNAARQFAAHRSVLEPVFALRNTGATTVMSGKCVPPRKGSFSMATSPGPSRVRPWQRAPTSAWSRDAPACDRPSPALHRYR